MRPEELDPLPPLRDPAPGTEAEPRFELLPAGRAGGHTRRICPPGESATGLQPVTVVLESRLRDAGLRGLRDRDLTVHADLRRQHLGFDPVAVALHKLGLR